MLVVRRRSVRLRTLNELQSFCWRNSLHKAWMIQDSVGCRSFAEASMSRYDSWE